MTFSTDAKCVGVVHQAVNFGERAPDMSLDMLVMHYTGMESAQAAINWLCAEESGVSCHYVVEEDGTIHQLVSESKRAWHAGVSQWQGIKDVNSRSIGIEIVNIGHGNGYPDFPDVQIDAVIELSRDILSRHTIPGRNVVAHSDVAPGRKQDPGEKFPWALLHENGVGHWVPEVHDQTPYLFPDEVGEKVAAVQALLSAYGYGIEISGEISEEFKQCVTAFQMHFRQSEVNGVVDVGTLKVLESLIGRLQRG